MRVNQRTNRARLTERERTAGTSRYKGVSPAFDGKWRAQIYYDGNSHGLGSAFDTEEDAARAYDAAVREHRGPNPAVNFPAPGSGERQAMKGQPRRPQAGSGTGAAPDEKEHIRKNIAGLKVQIRIAELKRKLAAETKAAALLHNSSHRSALALHIPNAPAAAC